MPNLPQNLHLAHTICAQYHTQICGHTLAINMQIRRDSANKIKNMSCVKISQLYSALFYVCAYLAPLIIDKISYNIIYNKKIDIFTSYCNIKKSHFLISYVTSKMVKQKQKNTKVWHYQVFWTRDHFNIQLKYVNLGHINRIHILIYLFLRRIM